MEELLGCDIYQVYTTGHISTRLINVLTQLYQPLIGAKAYGLYMFLYSEVDTLQLISIDSTHSRLSSFTSMSFADIRQSIKYLEGIGLLRTYVKYESQQTKYLYELLLPLEASQFFNNQLLNVLLYRTIGTLEYDKTKYLFRTPNIDFSGYDNISSNFDDVYFLNDTTVNNKIIKDIESFQQKTSKEPVFEYSLEMFYKELEMLQIRRRLITPAVEKNVKQLGIAYGISSQQMASLLSTSLNNDKIDLELLSKKARAYHELETPNKLKRVYQTQPVKYATSKDGNDPKSLHIKQLETWAPYKFISKKQGGKPVQRDLMIVERLMTELNLEAGVVNVLLELCWSQNDEMIVRNFIESIGATWKRKNINTVEEALIEAKEYLKFKNRKADDFAPEWFKDSQAESQLNIIDDISKTDDASGISDEELREMLRKL